MHHRFKTVYLVCVDHDNDINYVIARDASLKKARAVVERARMQYPDNEIYITPEKIPVYAVAANPDEDLCGCGAKPGRCIGNLSCPCDGLDLCKNTDTNRNPFDPYEFEELEYQDGSGYSDEDYVDEDYEEYEDNPFDIEDDEDEDEGMDENPFGFLDTGPGLEYSYTTPPSRFHRNPDEEEDEDEEDEEEMGPEDEDDEDEDEDVEETEEVDEEEDEPEEEEPDEEQEED